MWTPLFPRVIPRDVHRIEVRSHQDKGHASQPASEPPHGMGKPSWEVGRANKEEPRVLGARSSGWCKPWDWLHDLQQGRPGQQSSTLTSPDPSPQQAFTWTDSPAHSNRATAIKSKPPREGKCPSRPEPQPQNSLAWQQGSELLVATVPTPLLPKAMRLQEWSGGPSGLQKQALSWPWNCRCEGAHLLPTDPGNQATIGPYSEPLCNLENGVPARQKKKKEKNSVRNVPLGVGNTGLSRQKAPVC